MGESRLRRPPQRRAAGTRSPFRGRDDEYGPVRVVDHARGHAAEHRRGHGRSPARAQDDDPRVELLGEVENQSHGRRVTADGARLCGEAGGARPRTDSATVPRGSAMRAADATASNVVQAVATIAGPVASVAPARSIAARAPSDPS
jgi:hypothetical protein